MAPEQTRAEMFAASLLAGKPGEPIIKALDLAPPPEEPAGQGAAGPASPPAAQDGSKP